jgi:hypothetical protein
MMIKQMMDEVGHLWPGMLALVAGLDSLRVSAKGGAITGESNRITARLLLDQLRVQADALACLLGPAEQNRNAPPEDERPSYRTALEWLASVRCARDRARHEVKILLGDLRAIAKETLGEEPEDEVVAQTALAGVLSMSREVVELKKERDEACAILDQVDQALRLPDIAHDETLSLIQAAVSGMSATETTDRALQGLKPARGACATIVDQIAVALGLAATAPTSRVMDEVRQAAKARADLGGERDEYKAQWQRLDKLVTLVSKALGLRGGGRHDAMAPMARALRRERDEAHEERDEVRAVLDKMWLAMYGPDASEYPEDWVEGFIAVFKANPGIEYRNDGGGS